MYLKTTLKLLYCFGLYVCNSMFLLFNSFTMFMYAMELFSWILICSCMIFISYSEATFFSCYDNDKKLLTLITEMGGSLTVFSILMLLFSSSSFSSSPSKELIIDTGLLNWYLFIFCCLRGIDISSLFWFLFLLLTSIHGASTFVFCESCIICFEVSFNVFRTVHRISFRSRFAQ